MVEVVEVKPAAVCRKRRALPPSGLFQVSEPVQGMAQHEAARLWLREVSVERWRLPPSENVLW